MSDQSPNNARRRLDPNEMSGDDAATRQMPQPDDAANASVQRNDPPPPSPPARRNNGPQPRRNAATGSHPVVGSGANVGRNNRISTPQRGNAAGNPLVPPHVQASNQPPPRPPRTLPTPSRRFPWRNVLLVLLVLLLVGVGSAFWWAQGRLEVAQNIIYVPTIELPNLPLVPTSLPGEPTYTPLSDLPLPVTPLPAPNWAQEPFTILLVGIDKRKKSAEACREETPTPGEPEEAPLSDVMILTRVDPRDHTVKMLSIPRDFWVNIPFRDDGPHKINSAYQYGVQQDLPGGGPGMTIVTIQRTFGVHIDYYAEVDFQGFQKLVDAIGGIDIDVPYPLMDNEYPTECYGLERIAIGAGLQHMDGATALKYARSRHLDPSGDIGRNQRQQRVLLAIREKGISLQSLSNADSIIRSLGGSFFTNFPFGKDLIGLVNLAREINPSNVQQAGLTLEQGFVELGKSPNGQDILVPQWNKIRPLVASMFSVDQVWAEDASIQVLNGTEENGLASGTGARLQRRNSYYNIVDVGNAEPKIARTTITNYSGKTATSRQIALDLGLDPTTSVRQGTDGPEGIDIVVVAGDDLIPRQSNAR